MRAIIPWSTVRVSALALILALPLATPTAVAASREPLSGLQPKHPRLLFTPADQRRTEKTAKTDRLLRQLISANQRTATAMLTQPKVRYEIPDGKRLLAQSRKCLYRVMTMALAYRLSGDRRFADAAIAEMETAAGFKDWNPSHFLDTAEMTTALAVGYDWLFDVMDGRQRDTIRQAIIEKGLKPGLKIYRSGGWWTRTDNNWNQVCNGGMVLGALAIAESEPDLASEVVRFAIDSIPRGLSVYRPSGAYPEGPGYWQYGTEYTCVTLAAMESALGHDFGFGKTPGLDLTGYFRIYTIGPTELYFNYADAHEKSSLAASMFYLSRKYDQPVFAEWHRQRLVRRLKSGRASHGRFLALETVWYDPSGTPDVLRDLPLDKLFRSRQDVAILRDDWNDSAALYVGFKAGDNRANHGHLDVGSFVFDAAGVRWAIDLGSDNYNMPGYFGKQRWQYYRLTNLSHNTLVIGDEIQNPRAICRVTAFQSSPDRAAATVDMSNAYQDQARQVTRTVELIRRRQVRIVDRIEGAVGPVRWNLVTRAQIETQGNEAVLRQSGKRLVARIVEPSNASFQVISTSPPTSRENPNRGTRMLAITIDHPEKQQTIEVVLTPQTDDAK